MNKKSVLFCIVLISFILICMMFLYTNGVKYNKLVVDEETWNNLINERTITDRNLIESFKFNNYDAFYDKSMCTYYYSIIENSSNAYNPIIKYKINNPNAKIAINKEITDERIEDNETILILVYTDTEFSIYNLKCTTLPLLNINCENIEDMLTNEDTFDMSLRLFDNSKNAANRIIKSDGKMHKRGGMSSAYPKLGYKLSLTTKSLGNHTRNNNISLLGMRKDDDWILYAAYNDQEKVRNVFAMNLWNESCAKNNMFDVDNGNEYKYIEVFINNVYWGLYALGYPIDEKQLNLEPDNEYMFKKIQYNTAEEDVLNQNSLEMEFYRLINKTSNEEDAWNSLKNYYITLLQSHDTQELYNISDVNNVIDYYLFQEFIQGNDNAVGMHLKNVFITFKKYNNSQVALYSPWDYDLSMGNIYEDGAIAANAVLPYYVEVDKKIDFTFNCIGSLIRENDTNIIKLIKSRYKNLRETYWSEEHLEELISKYSKDIYDSGAYKREMQKWPHGTYSDDEKQKLKKFKKYVFERLKFVDGVIDEK